MLIDIHHKTTYTYSEPVFLEPHYLNFKPIGRSYLKLILFDLIVDPVPSGMVERLDPEGNPYIQIWMDDLIKEFTIEAKSRVAVTPYNPFYFLVDPPIDLKDPNFFYHERDRTMLSHFMKHEATDPIKKFVGAQLEASGYDVVDFIADLTRSIAEGWKHQVRMDDNILSPQVCFQKKKGSCRDLSLMLMEMLRATGFACRFVSGYVYNPELGSGHELHAWVEVLLPGAGWIGIDPSAGVLTQELYIPVATSFDPAFTMPVVGNYRGPAKSVMESAVLISVDD